VENLTSSMVDREEAIESLHTLGFIFIILLVGAVVWCFLSTCLGPQKWNMNTSVGRTRHLPSARRRRELGGSEGFVEEWEMEARGG